MVILKTKSIMPITYTHLAVLSLCVMWLTGLVGVMDASVWYDVLQVLFPTVYLVVFGYRLMELKGDEFANPHERRATVEGIVMSIVVIVANLLVLTIAKHHVFS